MLVLLMVFLSLLVESRRWGQSRQLVLLDPGLPSVHGCRRMAGRGSQDACCLTVQRHVHKFREVQQCTLHSIKTGGCSEDWSYCPQSSRYNTGLKAQKLMNKDVCHRSSKKGSGPQICSQIQRSPAVHTSFLKTGGCSEDCSYCPQASRYNTGPIVDEQR